MSKEIVILNKADWEKYTGLSGTVLETHANELRYNWFGCDTMRQVKHGSGSSSKPGVVLKHFQFGNNGQNSQMLEFGIGEHDAGTSARLYVHGTIDQLFEDSNVNSKRSGYEYHAKYGTSTDWYKGGVFECINTTDSGFYPYPVKGISFRLTTPKSQSNYGTVTSSNCKNNYGNQMVVNVIHGLWRHRTTGNYQVQELFHNGDPNANIPHDGGGNIKLARKSRTAMGNITDTSTKLPMGNHAQIRAYTNFDMSNYYFVGFSIQFHIPGNSAWHCYVQQVNRVSPIHQHSTPSDSSVVLANPSAPNDISVRLK